MTYTRTRRHLRLGQFARLTLLMMAILATSLVLAGCSSKSEEQLALEIDTQMIKPVASTREPTVSATLTIVPTARPELRSTMLRQRPSPVSLPTLSPAAEGPPLTLESPEPGQSIYSPVYVRGRGLVPFDRTLEVQVLTLEGEILGRGPIVFDTVTPFGEEAVYEGTLPFRQPGHQQLGSVRVLMRSTRDDLVVDVAQVLVALLPAGSGPIDITIDTPVAGTVIGNPVRVEGTALAPQNQITVRLKSGPAVFAAEMVPLSDEIGQPGRFRVDLHYDTLPAALSNQPGYPSPSEIITGEIEAFYRSPEDGRMAQIASVPVVIPWSVSQ